MEHYIPLFSGKTNDDSTWITGQFLYGYAMDDGTVTGYIRKEVQGFLREIKVHPESVSMHTGIELNGRPVMQHQIYRTEEAHDHGDRRNFYIVEYIREWGMFGLLDLGDEYTRYRNEGIKALDYTMFWGFTLEQMDETFVLCDHLFDNPQWLETGYLDAKISGLTPEEFEARVKAIKNDLTAQDGHKP